MQVKLLGAAWAQKGFVGAGLRDLQAPITPYSGESKYSADQMARATRKRFNRITWSSSAPTHRHTGGMSGGRREHGGRRPYVRHVAVSRCWRVVPGWGMQTRAETVHPHRTLPAAALARAAPRWDTVFRECRGKRCGCRLRSKSMMAQGHAAALGGRRPRGPYKWGHQGLVFILCQPCTGRCANSTASMKSTRCPAVVPPTVTRGGIRDSKELAWGAQLVWGGARTPTWTSLATETRAVEEGLVHPTSAGITLKTGTEVMPCVQRFLTARREGRPGGKTLVWLLVPVPLFSSGWTVALQNFISSPCGV